MRLFVAFDIEESIRDRIADFIEQMRPLASGVRWVSVESLHVTLKFIGEQPDNKTKEIEAALATVHGTSFSIAFHGYGFFSSARSARVFWVGIEAGPELSSLALLIEGALGTAGIEREKREFNPHLTLARAVGASGAPGRHRSDRRNQHFRQLQQYLSQGAPPELGTMLATEFFLYRSQLSSQGSRYIKLARYSLAKDA